MKIQFLIMLSLLAILTSCSKDPGPCGGQKIYYYLSEEDKAKVAYTGTDTLIFVSNTSDTVVCIGQGKKQFYETYSSPVNNGDCDPATYYYEAFNYRFKTNNLNFKLDFTIYKNDLTGLETIHIFFNNVDYKLYLVDLGNSKVSNYVDSIKIYNDWNKKVTTTLGFDNIVYGKLFYNQEKGILKIQNNDSTNVWQLLNKK